MAQWPATSVRMAARVGREHEALPQRLGMFNEMPLLRTCCYPPAWHKIYRQLLGQLNLLQRHFAGQGIAQPQNIFAIMPRRVRCCEVDPFMGENDILGDAEALIAAPLMRIEELPDPLVLRLCGRTLRASVVRQGEQDGRTR